MSLIKIDGVAIEGEVAPGFEAVAERFAANFTRGDEHRETGASFAAYRDGAPVVDIWAGWRDAARTRRWTRDTLVNVWSTTKGVTAIALAMLVDRGLIDYDAPVADYWPAFAQAGKGEITVSQLLSHQAGLPGFVEPTPLADFYDWATVTERLAAQAPMWPAGEKNSYHAMTYGFLAGELIRRASGKSVGAFLAEEIASPLGADILIGLPEAEEPRIATMLGPRTPAPFDPDQLPPEAAAAISNPEMRPDLPHARAWRAAEIPAGNGHASAAGLARLYAAVAGGGTLDGVRLMSRGTIARLTEVQTEREDIMLGFKPFWAHGVALNDAGVFGPNPRAFGHSGWGGSFACADVENRLSIAYAMNQMGAGLVGDPRAVELCHTLYDCLERKAVSR
ncbi:MAG: beta-lactamase family protein [Caulobacteraceae bacterium]|nr:beta-lactamase family protein [Caulobacteraceae bacterium]